MPPTASLLVSIAIPTFSVLTFALIAYALLRIAGDAGRLARLFILGASAWLLFTGVLAASGFLARFELRPPPFLVVFLPTIALPIWLSRSRVGELLCERAPLAWLVGFQAFRVPLELVMHEAAAEGTMPPQMTFTGANFDIITGLTAVAVAAAIALGYAPRWLIAAWNALGSLLLLNILVIAIASLPMFHAFGNDPAQLNTWVAYFPFVWLPAALVTSALFGHAVVWRKLVRDARKVRASKTSAAPHTSLA